MGEGKKMLLCCQAGSGRQALGAMWLHAAHERAGEARLGWLAWAELLALRPSLFIYHFPFLLFSICLLKAFAHQRIN